MVSICQMCVDVEPLNPIASAHKYSMEDLCDLNRYEG